MERRRGNGSQRNMYLLFVMNGGFGGFREVEEEEEEEPFGVFSAPTRCGKEIGVSIGK